MPHCHPHGSCHLCSHAVDRRRFFTQCGAAGLAAAGSLASLSSSSAASGNDRPVRVAVVILAQARDSWPYPGFDAEGRQQQILTALREGVPGVEFVPVMVKNIEQVTRATGMADDVDGYLVYVATLSWSLRRAIATVAKLGKPTMVADEFLGGCGAFLTGCSNLASHDIPVAPVSTTRLSDLITVAQQFAHVKQPGTTQASFARECNRAYRATFPEKVKMEWDEKRLSLHDIAECVKRFQNTRFLIVGRGHGGQERDFLGATGRYIDFEELQSFYGNVDWEEAAEWAARWSESAQPLPPGNYVEPSQPDPAAIEKAGGVYLATRELLKKYDTDTVTMNCLGGFSAGKLPAYPCLGFMELLNEGGQGVCEAMPDDTLSMLMARLLTGRPGFVSDPALDTSQNRIVYSHCVGTTKVFGPDGDANGFRIRTLHNRDPRGACVESLMPAGYMTTSFRTNAGRKQLIIHQAKAMGALESEK